MIYHIVFSKKKSISHSMRMYLLAINLTIHHLRHNNYNNYLTPCIAIPMTQIRYCEDPGFIRVRGAYKTASPTP